eukprot:NODE_790_length_1174_cov_140.527111_g640_i0.p1 GENE.NODE_790_length_1174_cov_140.527111_g640_i0~~NODE_790_length_1174_cov_140.527111_g640_i0.p1  ORF type:complete len:296 (-),score=43.32 NODE_790_length_1174_cov_140.527111_g640_i0:287-1147(-)
MGPYREADTTEAAAGPSQSQLEANRTRDDKDMDQTHLSVQQAVSYGTVQCTVCGVISTSPAPAGEKKFLLECRQCYRQTVHILFVVPSAAVQAACHEKESETLKSILDQYEKRHKDEMTFLQQRLDLLERQSRQNAEKERELRDQLATRASSPPPRRPPRQPTPPAPVPVPLPVVLPEPEDTSWVDAKEKDVAEHEREANERTAKLQHWARSLQAKERELESKERSLSRSRPNTANGPVSPAKDDPASRTMAAAAVLQSWDSPNKRAARWFRSRTGLKGTIIGDLP